MSILDLLLETDIEKLKSDNSQNIEIKRLSKVLGEKFIVTCHPLTHEDVTHIGAVSYTHLGWFCYPNYIGISKSKSMKSTGVSTK